MSIRVNLDEPSRNVIIDFVDTYLSLSSTEDREFEQLLAELNNVPEKEEVAKMVTSWEQKGIEKGRKEGRQEGLQEGLQEAVRLIFGDAISDEEMERLSKEKLQLLVKESVELHQSNGLRAWLDTHLGTSDDNH